MTVDQTIRDPFEVKSLSPADVIAEFRGLVGSIVNELAARLKIRVEYEDLEAYGFKGLLEAHDRYDPSTRSDFASYAYYRIRGSILDGCRKEGWLTRDRASRAKTLAEINEYMATTSATRAATPPPRGFSDAVDRVSRVVADTATIFLLHEADLGGAGAQAPANQHRQMARNQLVELLAEAFAELDEQERDVVIRFHFENERMDDIAHDFGHSRSWVSRINTRAIEKLRAYILERQ